MNRTVKIYKVTHGRFKGQWRFTLVADNYEPIASSEAYANKEDVIQLVGKYFPEFKIDIHESIGKKTKN